MTAMPIRTRIAGALLAGALAASASFNARADAILEWNAKTSELVAEANSAPRRPSA